VPDVRSDPFVLCFGVMMRSCALLRRHCCWRYGGAAAQEFRATVKGRSSFEPGSVRATVTVRNQETGEVATATTNQQGTTRPLPRPGLYTMTVELSGFKYTGAGCG
jgi:hypothetical protein